eukprot:TRINITY_DN11862_c0_g4_i1.p1 TRINITY_DN11862_c0_g4~~TRINITY_DN11862_c0_g4_i1.p1  ORF type:complete len:290 (+),score=29.04 TRINITY_DN11862_c0_g4_i1:43-870(+)
MQNRISFNSRIGCPLCTIVANIRSDFNDGNAHNVTYHDRPAMTGQPRTDQEVHDDSLHALQHGVKRRQGAHYGLNPLLLLGYFSVIAATPADTMHMLYLGICKWLIGFLIREVLSKRDINDIEADIERLRKMLHYSWISERPPSGIFKTPKSGKAAQYRNFFHHFFALVMRAYLSDELYKACMHLVMALEFWMMAPCNLSHLARAQAHFQTFWVDFAGIYPDEPMPPNMHRYAFFENSAHVVSLPLVMQGPFICRLISTGMDRHVFGGASPTRDS